MSVCNRDTAGYCKFCGNHETQSCGIGPGAVMCVPIEDHLHSEQGPSSPILHGECISPSHYSRYEIEPIDFIERNNLGFSVGNVIKYVCRFDAKNGIEDLEKAMRYLEFLMAKAQGQAPSSVNE